MRRWDRSLLERCASNATLQPSTLGLRWEPRARRVSCMTPRKAIHQNVFQLAEVASTLDAPSFHRIYKVSCGVASCQVGTQLANKYSVGNNQTVVSFTNIVTCDQAWFNEVRTRKPQTFKTDVNFADPTDNGSKCDFCKWDTYTAEDTFGRIELTHAVTGSNLFKYCEPCHGIVLFKHHNPLEFSLEQLSDLLLASQMWFAKAYETHPNATHPFFIWNCLPRAGASQYHGHGQLMLSSVPVPTQQLINTQSAAFLRQHGSDFYEDLLQAHSDVGLLRSCSCDGDMAHVFASLAPVKDMELLVMGSSITSPAFVRAMHAALRTLIDRLGTQTFNVGILNITPHHAAQRAVSSSEGKAAASSSGAGRGGGGGGSGPPVMARIVNRGKMSSQASDYGCLEVFGGASIGHTDPYTVMSHLDEVLKVQAA